MAMTHDYLDYLNDKVGISAAGSQEELQAAQTISHLMGQHDVEPQVEDFEAPSLAGLAPAIVSIVMVLGMFVSGFGIVALSLVGFVLAAIPTVLAVLRLLGHEVSLSFGPRTQSQNVVAVHRATGPLVTKGNRTIVVVAHYDSPRENILYSSPVAPFLPLVTKASSYCVYVVAACALLQVMVFIPSVARIIIWLVGILASVPSVTLAVGAISERVSDCTMGANDNKSSVAALLGVMENVRPSGIVPIDRTPRPEPEPQPMPAEEPLWEPSLADEPVAGVEQEPPARPDSVALRAEREESAPETFAGEMDEPWDEPPAEDLGIGASVPGVRHGEDVLRSLGILPEGCEIEYVMPPAAHDEPTPTATPADGRTAPVLESDFAPMAPSEEPSPEAPSAADPLWSPAPEEVRVLGPDAGLGAVTAPAGVADKGTLPTGPLPAAADVASASSEVDDTLPSSPVQAGQPASPDDSEWGRSSYRPSLSSVARRATLFDLPDPSAKGVDPFDSTGSGAAVPPAQQVQGVSPVPVGGQVIAPEPISTIHSPSTEERPMGKLLESITERVKGLKDKIFGSKGEASEDGGWFGSSSEGDGDDPVWRGGATIRDGLRLVEGEGAPSEDELREAVLSLGDDALISHDIWFVALGGSSLDHAGMRAFLREHRSEVRGCFVVNLDCVGAGELSVLTHEGLDVTRHCDRRLARLLVNSANDIHSSLAQRSYDWSSTDAHVAMRSSMRSVTLMGVDKNGLPALSRTPADTPENVSGDQAAQVAEVVTEMIRRS